MERGTSRSRREARDTRCFHSHGLFDAVGRRREAARCRGTSQRSWQNRPHPYGADDALRVGRLHRSSLAGRAVSRRVQPMPGGRWRRAGACRTYLPGRVARSHRHVRSRRPSRLPRIPRFHLGGEHAAYAQEATDRRTPGGFVGAQPWAVGHVQDACQGHVRKRGGALGGIVGRHNRGLPLCAEEPLPL